MRLATLELAILGTTDRLALWTCTMLALRWTDDCTLWILANALALCQIDLLTRSYAFRRLAPRLAE